MLKKILFTLLIAISCSFSYGQSKMADSLRAELAKVVKPIDRFDILNRLVLELTGWRGDNADSTYSEQMFLIAQELKNDSLLAISYNWLGSYFYQNKGNNSTALEYYFKALPLVDKTTNKRRISSLYFDIALVYFDLKNNEAAVANTRKGGENLPDKSHPLYDFMLIQYQGNMAQYFLLVNQPDSSFQYIKDFTETNKRMNGGANYDFTELTMKGAAYAQIKNVESADKNFKKAIALSNAEKGATTALFFYTNYIPFLLSNNRIEEAGFQAKRLLKKGILSKNNNLKLAGANFLRRVFDAKHKVDSAYYYSQMEATINAEIFSQTNVNRIQALAFNDQLRKVEDQAKEETYRNQLRRNAFLGSIFTLIVIAIFLFRNNRQKSKSKKKIEKAYDKLKSTQSQLIQSEKMASLGELTAGIAHEIQNPLNFVNNFSEVSGELVDEMEEEIDEGNIEGVKELATDLKQNLEKINHHGQRASSIVKGMLEHSRTGDGTKELTDINKLADEYLRLSYHGLRAKDKSFNADFKTDFDVALPKIKVVPQDIGRVLLNLINNAFQACTERSRGVAINKDVSHDEDYQPTVIVSTKWVGTPLGAGGSVEIRVKDNGSGISDDIKDKIFEPFFTTKPTGQGTGLGLSMSYDIVTKGHGGEIKVETKEDKGTTFRIKLPLQ